MAMGSKDQFARVFEQDKKGAIAEAAANEYGRDSKSTVKKVHDDIFQETKSRMHSNSRGGEIDPSDTTSSSGRVSDLKISEMTNSTYGNALLEKLVIGQNNNTEFTNSTLTFQSSSLALLAEIKEGILSIGGSGKSTETQYEPKERENSQMAKDIAELNIPSLYKNLKKAGIRMVDKMGIIGTAQSTLSAMMDGMGEMDIGKMMRDKIVGVGKEAVLGKKNAKLLEGFEENPLSTIQGLINKHSMGSNPLLSALFGGSHQTVELNSKTNTGRDDMYEAKNLGDRLTHNTLNFRIPDVLDNILSAVSGNEKQSYDYASNSFMKDSDRIKMDIDNRKIVRKSDTVENIMSDLTSNIEERFEAKEDGLTATKVRNMGFTVDDDGSILSGDDGEKLDTNASLVRKAISSVLGSKASLAQLYNADIPKFMRTENLNIKHIFGRGNEAEAEMAFTLLQRRLQLFDEEQLNSNESSLEDYRNSYNKKIHDDNSDTTQAILRKTSDSKRGMKSPSNVKDINRLERQFDEGIISNDEYSDAMVGLLDRGQLNKSFDIKGGFSGVDELTLDTVKYRIPDVLDNILYAITGMEFKAYDPDIQQHELKRVEPKKEVNELQPKQDKVKISRIRKNRVGPEYKREGQYDGSNVKASGNIQSVYHKPKEFGADIDKETRSESLKDYITDPVGENESKKDIEDRAASLKIECITLWNAYNAARMTRQQVSEDRRLDMETDSTLLSKYPDSPTFFKKYLVQNSNGNWIMNDNLVNNIVNAESARKLKKSNRANTGQSLGKLTSEGLNAIFGDPSTLKKMGFKAGAGTGYAIGKLLQSKGIISSPYAPYLMGGLGGMILNMSSVRNSLSAVLGDQGDLKNENGITNKEIFVSKLVNKVMPLMVGAGAGMTVAKKVNSLFAGSGLMGRGIGMLGGLTLGLATTAAVPILANMARSAMYDPAKQGEEAGFITKALRMVGKIPVLEKIINGQGSIKSNTSDSVIVNMSIQSVQDELTEIYDKLDDKDKAGNKGKSIMKALNRLREIKSGTNFKIDRIENDESDESYQERIKEAIIGEVNNVIEDVAETGAINGDEVKTVFTDRIASNFKIKENFATRDQNKINLEIGADTISRNLKSFDNMSPDELVSRYGMTPQSSKETNEEFAERSMKFLTGQSDDENKEKSQHFYKKRTLAKSIEGNFGDRNENLVNLMNGNLDDKKHIDDVMRLFGIDPDIISEADDGIKATIDTNSDLNEILEDTEVKRILSEKEVNYAALKKHLKSNPELKEKVDELTQDKSVEAMSVYRGTVYNEDVGEKMTMIAEGLFNRDDANYDKKVHDQVTKWTSRLNDAIFGKEEMNIAQTIRAKWDKWQYDMGVGDEPPGEDPQKQKIRQTSKLLNLLTQNNYGKGTGVKMKDLSKFKFKDGRSLSVSGCSVAAFNNMLVAMGMKEVGIKELIPIANMYLQTDGSVSKDFFTEVAERFGFTIEEYSRSRGNLNEKVIDETIPSSTSGVIILKRNPGLNYGHFVTRVGKDKINDPEVSGLTKCTNSDILLTAEIIMVFKKKGNDTVKPFSDTLIKKIKNSMASGLLGNITSGTIIGKMMGGSPKPETSSGISGGQTSDISGESSGGSSLDSLMEFLKNGVLNVKIVDDATLPLTVGDGTVAKEIIKKRKSMQGLAAGKLDRVYEGVAKSDKAKHEDKRRDAVQDAIIGGALAGGATSGMGSGANALAGDSSQQQGMVNQGGGGGGGGLVGTLIGAATTFGPMAYKFLKNKGAKIAGEGIEAGVKNPGFVKTAVSFAKTAGKMIYKFFGAIFKKAPKFLKPILGKLTKTLATFVPKVTTALAKFFSSASSQIMKRVPIFEAKSVAAKLGPMTLLILVGTFLYSAWSGYNDAPRIMYKLFKTPPEQVDQLSKIGIGLAKGVVVALPGYLMSLVSIPGSGFIGAGLEIFMETIGFELILDWVFKSDKEESVELSKEEQVSDMSMVEGKEAETMDATMLQTEKNGETGNSTVDGQSDDSTTKVENVVAVTEPEIEKESSLLDRFIDAQKYTPMGMMMRAGKNTYDYLNNKLVENKNSIQGLEKTSMGTEGAPGTDEEATFDPNSLEKNELKVGNNGYTMPVDNQAYRITSTFGHRNRNGEWNPHRGIDIGAKVPNTYGQDKIYSVKGGKVTATGGTMNRVEVTSDDGIVSRYLHLNDISVKNGAKVEAGQVVGTMGGYGVKNGRESRRAYDSHLHLDMKKGDTWIDPIKELNLDPNHLKLPSEENAAYLNRKINKDVASTFKAEIPKVPTVFKRNEPSMYRETGGDDISEAPMNNQPTDSGVGTKDLIGAINSLPGKIGESIKIPAGANINIGDTLTIKLLNSIDASLRLLTKISTNQGLKLDNLAMQVNGLGDKLRIDPADISDIMSSRVSSSY